MSYADDITITQIIKDCRTIAVMGLSSNSARPSYAVASVLGEPAYPSLMAVSGAIDLVDVFREAEDVLPVVEAAIVRGVKAIWLQEGIVNEAAAALAKQAGLLVVIDRCWVKEHTAWLYRG